MDAGIEAGRFVTLGAISVLMLTLVVSVFASLQEGGLNGSDVISALLLFLTCSHLYFGSNVARWIAALWLLAGALIFVSGLADALSLPLGEAELQYIAITLAYLGFGGALLLMKRVRLDLERQRANRSWKATWSLRWITFVSLIAIAAITIKDFRTVMAEG